MLAWGERKTRLRRRLRALVLGLAFATPVMALDRGTPAPLFELTGHETPASVKLAAYLGKFVYLDFWASWCAPCRQSFPWMNEMQARYGTQGLQIIGVNLDAKKEDAAAFLQTTPAHFLLAFDPAGTTPRSYGVKSMPTGFLIGPDGKILFEHRGFNQADSAEFEGKIKAALGAQK